MKINSIVLFGTFLGGLVVLSMIQSVKSLPVQTDLPSLRVERADEKFRPFKNPVAVGRGRFNRDLSEEDPNSFTQGDDEALALLLMSKIEKSEKTVRSIADVKSESKWRRI